MDNNFPQEKAQSHLPQLPASYCIIELEIASNEVYNCDETAGANIHGATDILAPSEQKQVGKVTSKLWDGGASYNVRYSFYFLEIILNSMWSATYFQVL